MTATWNLDTEPPLEFDGPRSTWAVLLDLVCGRRVSEEESNAKSQHLIIAGTLGTLVLTALWGLAAGSVSWSLAIANVAKVPMVVLLSTVAAMPSALLALKLSGSRMAVRDLLVSVTSALFGGSLVMAASAPLLALYYYSSAWAGPMLASGSVWLALVAGGWVMLRSVWHRRPYEDTFLQSTLPVVVLLGMMSAVLLQMVAIIPPILPDPTVFNGGIDQLIGG